MKAALLWLNFFYGTGRRTEYSQLFVNTEEIDISLSISVNNENLHNNNGKLGPYQSFLYKKYLQAFPC